MARRAASSSRSCSCSSFSPARPTAARKVSPCRSTEPRITNVATTRMRSRSGNALPSGRVGDMDKAMTRPMTDRVDDHAMIADAIHLVAPPSFLLASAPAMGCVSAARWENAYWTAITKRSTATAATRSCQRGQLVSPPRACGSARPARRKSALETMRPTSSQNATALMRASDEEIGAPVRRLIRTVEITRAAAVMAATPDTPSAVAARAAA
jgi:hypothetical protein